MANTNISLLYPALFASAFDGVDIGQYNLPFQVSRSMESVVANYGASVTVPLAVSLSGEVYTPGETITAQSITQQVATVTLNKPKRVTIDLTEAELSLSPYELQTVYAIPMLEGLLKSVNDEIVTVMATATTNTDITISGTIDADDVRSARKTLDGQKVGMLDRFLVIPSDWYNDLLSDTEFQNINELADKTLIEQGVINRRYGFDIGMNHSMSTAGYAFHKGAIAFAARTYREPQAPGTASQVVSYKGLPIRIVMKYTDNFVLRVQADILFGVSLVKGSRIVKITS